MRVPEDNGARLRRALERPDDFRVLERLVIQEGMTGEGDADDQAPGGGVGVVVDVETMGFDLERDPVIELGLRRFRYDASGIMTKIDRAYSWCEDPGRAVPAEITKVTGLRDADVAGQAIDADAVRQLVTNTSVCIAHNAAFDRPRVERQVPGLVGHPWACSMTEIPWADNGFEGLRLGPLLNGCGFFHSPHRAVADVDAVVGLLRHRLDDGRTALSALLGRASQPSWVIRALGASFDVKDLLKARGYRWAVPGGYWWREVFEADREDEEWWLAANIYAAEARPRRMCPEWIQRDWRTRHG